MKTRFLFPGTVVATLALSLGFAWAQGLTTGAIEGTVVDNQHVARPGVTIVITSTQGTKTTTTDTYGRYSFQGLPVGTVILKALLDGFNPVERQSLEVHQSERLRVDIAMTPGGNGAVDVADRPPVLEARSATQAVNIPNQLVESIATPRNFSGVLNLAPGVAGGGIPGSEDSNPAIGGASGLENTYTVDGVDIGNTGFGSAGSFAGLFGALGTGLNFDSIKEVQVNTGGYDPEFGAALGGSVHVVTKTGTNTTTGSAFTYYQADGLEGNRATTDRLDALYDPVGVESVDFGFEAGGPLVRDKAFWYAAFNPAFTTRTRRTPKATRDALGFDHTMDSRRSTYNYAVNGVWYLNRKHRLTLSAFGDPATGTLGPQRDDALVVADPNARFSSLKFGGNNITGHWSGELRPTWFSDGSISYHGDRFKEDLAVDQPHGVDNRPAVPVSYGGVGSFTNSDAWSLQYRLNFTNRVDANGEHGFRYGAEFQDIHYDNTASYSGAPGTITLPDGRASTSGYSWDIRPDATVAGGAIFRVNRVRVDELTTNTKARYAAFYGSDTWSILPWINVMAGVRYEQETVTGTLSKHTWDGNWSPRLHLTVDPTRDNKTKLAAAYGRFFGKVPQDLAVRAMSSAATAVINYPIDNVDLSDPNNPRIIDPNNIVPDGFFVFGDTPARIDEGSGLAYQDEYVASAEREILPFVSIGVSYTNRQLGRTLENVGLASYSAILTGSETFGEYLITNPSPAQGFPKPTRKYDAVTLKLSRQLHDRWQFLSSYTWSRLRGNYEGYFRRDNSQANPLTTSMFDFAYLNDPDIFKYLIEDGKLMNDRPHVITVAGSYGFGFKMTAGLTLRVASGVPKTKLGFNEVYASASDYPIESRGTSGRTPTTTDVGVHLDYPLEIRGNHIEMVFDVFNFFNQQNALDYEHAFERGGAIDPVPPGLPPCPECENPDFGKATVFQQPRQIRLAARSRF